MSDQSADRFGNWLQVRSGGLFGLSTPALVAGGIGATLTLLLLMRQAYWAMLAVLLITAAIILVVFVQVGGQTLIEKLVDRRSIARRRATGETLYVSGPLSTLPAEVMERMPGALVDVETISGEDGRQRPFTLLHHEHVGKLAAVFGCKPNGSAMQEQSVINSEVARFGGWIGQLPVEEGLDGAVIVVDSTSESTAGMVQTVRESRAKGAPDFAAEVMEAACRTLPARTASVNVYGTLVYDAAELGATPSDVSSAVTEIATRMPGQTDQLAAAGAGVCDPLTETDLSRIAQLAYLPSRDQEMALDELRGQEYKRPLTMAGPQFFDDGHGEVVFHDGVCSLTAMMTAPPASHITARTLDRLLGPNAKFLRKRVAIFYRPVDPGTARKTVDRQVRNAQFRMDTRRSRPTSFDKQRKAVAEKTEEELSQGARLTMFAVMVTVTFAPTEKGYRDAVNQLKSLMNQTLMEYRFIETAGSAAFHLTLPFGVLPWLYSRKPVWMEGA